MHRTTSEPDLRRCLSQVVISPAQPVPRLSTSVAPPQVPTGWRDKTLPPLPGDVHPRSPILEVTEPRPCTLFSYDMLEVIGGLSS